MTKDQKNEVIEVLKAKFTQYNNFYITDTEALSVEQVSNLRRTCFDKKVEMKVAKNTLIRKALESPSPRREKHEVDLNTTAHLRAGSSKPSSEVVPEIRTAV